MTQINFTWLVTNAEFAPGSTQISKLFFRAEARYFTFAAHLSSSVELAAGLASSTVPFAEASEQAKLQWLSQAIPAQSREAIESQLADQVKLQLKTAGFTPNPFESNSIDSQTFKEIRPATDPILPTPPNYYAFWDALLASEVYGSIRTQSMASLAMNTLATEFIALIGDAKAGRPSETAIQASMSAVFATGTFTEADAEEFTDALAAGLLDDIYSLA